VTGGKEVIASHLKTFSNAHFTQLEVGTRIVVLLVTDFAVNLEHAVNVLANMHGDWLGESVLGVGIDVHLHNAIGDSVADVLEVRTRTTVEDEEHTSIFTVLSSNSVLAVAKDARLELHSTGLVHAVNVTEGSSEHELADRSKSFVGEKHVLRRGVKLVSRVTRVVNTVFFTTNNTDFDFEDDAEFCTSFNRLLESSKF
jgi:hypothetical protein